MEKYDSINRFFLAFDPFVKKCLQDRERDFQDQFDRKQDHVDMRVMLSGFEDHRGGKHDHNDRLRNVHARKEMFPNTGQRVRHLASFANDRPNAPDHADFHNVVMREE